MDKLRTSTPGLTEVLIQSQVNKLISDLFPRHVEKAPVPALSLKTWKEEWDVSEAEVYGILRSPATTKAPGPDGILNKMWKKIPNEMIGIIARTFTECLRKGEFPRDWKAANLVLIPKGGDNNQLIPKSRPICLLDEIGKLLERLIVSRIDDWMESRYNDGFSVLCGNQFGFRRNRFTVDALIKVRTFIENKVKQGKVVMAVSLDIKNAFNSIPWQSIRKALERMTFPMYLRRILHNYRIGKLVISIKKATSETTRLPRVYHKDPSSVLFFGMWYTTSFCG